MSAFERDLEKSMVGINEPKPSKRSHYLALVVNILVVLLITTLIVTAVIYGYQHPVPYVPCTDASQCSEEF